MPDMEKINDQLRIDMAEIGFEAKGKSSDYWSGFSRGKSHARFEIAIIFTIICFGIDVILHYYT